jgi:HD-GYP domain-containing protein (c-di-GMP phosphodiesterase class II)
MISQYRTQADPGLAPIHKPAAQRLLAKYLGMAALAISLVWGIAIFIVEYYKIGGQVVDRAQHTAMLLNVQLEHLLDKPGLLEPGEFQSALERLGSQLRERGVGRFAAIDINDINSLELASMSDRQYAHAEAVATFMKVSRQRVLLPDADLYENVAFNGAAHVYLVLPLRKSNGEVAAYATGIFTLTGQVFSQIYRKIFSAIVLVIAVIALTTLALYPIISLLLAKLVKLCKRLLDANLDMLEVLGSAIAKRDSDTDLHNYRVAIYSVRIAEAIGTDRGSTRSLIKGAFLHDIGKISISDNILQKPGRLNELEFDAMKKHVQLGLDIVAGSEWLADTATVVGFHHEKYDGSGYSQSISGMDIPLNARIFAIADVFDALTSERPYKKAYNFSRAMKILQEGSGTHFDPLVLEAFGKISEQLHSDYAYRDDDKPREDLSTIVNEYFRSEIEWIEGI